MIFTLQTFHVERKDYAEFVNISEETPWALVGRYGRSGNNLGDDQLRQPRQVAGNTQLGKPFRRCLGTRRAGQRYGRDRFATSNAAVSDEV